MTEFSDLTPSQTAPFGLPLVATVPVSSAEILALNSSPKLLIPAPGAGKVIIPLPIISVYKFDTAPYVLDGNAFVQHGVDDPTWPIGECSRLISSEDKLEYFYWSQSNAPLADLDNKGIYLRSTTSNPYGLGSIATAVLAAGGTGYQVGDTGTIPTGNSDATYTVLSVDGGGAVLTFSITAPGTGYKIRDTVFTEVITGAGDEEFCVNITALSNSSSGTLDLTIPYNIFNLP